MMEQKKEGFSNQETEFWKNGSSVLNDDKLLLVTKFQV